MKRYHLYILTSLLCSLLIYMCFRSENIFINQIAKYFFDYQPNQNQLQIHYFFIYNLPQGLWVFSATLISKNLYIKRFNLAVLPLIFSFYIETIQYFHLSNGTFDIVDLLTASIGFLIAYYMIYCPYKKEQLLQCFSFRTILFSSSYLIVFLSVYNIHFYFFK